ncbi:MAG: DUF167 domain-containing protein [Alphaproteobacteria bacterium]|nr:DUF167 domain-containing protein [Alphaproteobacteria bacterium]
MARPRIVTPEAATIRDLLDVEGRLLVRVTPGARSEALEAVKGKLLAKVRARPHEGAANAAVTRLLASALGFAPSWIELVRGASLREKMFRISD